MSDAASEDSLPAVHTKGALTFSSRTFHRLQLCHFVLFDVSPLIGTLFALIELPVIPPSALDITMFAFLWLATGLGLTVGFHRYFSHRSFLTTPTVAALLLILGSMAARGSMISWVAMHRRHHQRSDKEGDPHSPNLHGSGTPGKLRGFLHAHIAWIARHDYPNVAHYVPDHLKDRMIVRFNRRYYLWVTLGLMVPTLIGGGVTRSLAGAALGFLWGGIVRMFVVEHTMSSINSLCHLVGTRRFTMSGDNSHNNIWLGLPTWGESYHNNHHAFPASAAFGLYWHEVDLGFWFIRALETVGLAWNVKSPSAAVRRGSASNNL